MKGTRPLDNDEIRKVSACFDGTYGARNRGLFMLSVSTGGLISELLNLQVGDVYQIARRLPIFTDSDENHSRRYRIGEYW